LSASAINPKLTTASQDVGQPYCPSMTVQFKKSPVTREFRRTKKASGVQQVELKNPIGNVDKTAYLADGASKLSIVA
jgi:hypothetical protein